MRQNLDGDISLEKIANNLNISTRHLSGLFKRETQLTYSEHLNRLRMKRAKFLLNQTDRSILEISLLVGMQNQAYFTSLFKKSVGLTPTQFRNSKKDD